MKELFIIKLILTQFDYNKKIMVKYNFSGYIIKNVLSQYNRQGFLKPYTYFLKKNSSTKYNYKIHNKELLAIIYCFKNWDTELKSIKKFMIITDHKNLEYFMSFRKLNEKQMK